MKLQFSHEQLYRVFESFSLRQSVRAQHSPVVTTGLESAIYIGRLG